MFFLSSFLPLSASLELRKEYVLYFLGSAKTYNDKETCYIYTWSELVILNAQYVIREQIWGKLVILAFEFLRTDEKSVFILPFFVCCSITCRCILISGTLNAAALAFEFNIRFALGDFGMQELRVSLQCWLSKCFGSVLMIASSQDELLRGLSICPHMAFLYVFHASGGIYRSGQCSFLYPSHKALKEISLCI